MKEIVCIECGHAVFLDPTREICYKTGGLYCRKLKTIVEKYGPCRLKGAARAGKRPRKRGRGRSG